MTPVGAGRPGSATSSTTRKTVGARTGSATATATAPSGEVHPRKPAADSSNNSAKPPMSPRAPGGSRAQPSNQNRHHQSAAGSSLPALSGSASSSRRAVATGGSQRPATSRSAATSTSNMNSSSSALPPPASGIAAGSARDHSVLLTQQLLLERQYWCTKYTFTGMRARIERRLYQRELTAMWSERTEHSPYWSNQTRELATAEKTVEKWRVSSARAPRLSLLKLVNTTRFDEPDANAADGGLPSSVLHWSPLSHKSADPEVSQEAAMAAVRVTEDSPKRQRLLQ